MVEVLSTRDVKRIYSKGIIGLHRKRFDAKIELIRTNIIGVRDQQLQIILEQLLDLINDLSEKVECIGDNIHEHKEVFIW